jgi:hypothetical protein
MVSWVDMSIGFDLHDAAIMAVRAFSVCSRWFQGSIHMLKSDHINVLKVLQSA